MKQFIFIALLMVSRVAFADGLPVFYLQPTNQIASPGSTATFVAAATGAMSYQWLFDGTNIFGATNATLQVVNVQPANAGYYLAVAENSTGCVSGQMAYLFLDYTAGIVPSTAGGVLPLSSTNNTYFAGDVLAYYSGSLGAPTNGTVQIVAGPQLDQMQPVGALVHYRVSPASNRFYNGYFNAPDQSAFNNTSDKFITTFAPGQAYYYSVVVNYTNYGIATMQPSTVLKLVAGTNGLPAPSNYGLKFPGWIPAETTTDPWLGYPNSPTNQLRVTGETFSLTNSYSAYTDYGLPVFQWRKDGVLIGSPQSFIPDVNSPQTTANGTIILTITNAQPSDAGVYDVDVRGNLWFIGEKIYVSIQTTNGQGVFQDPKFINQNFVCDLVGAAGRNYKVQQSTNLVNWSDLVTLSNLAGTVTFTNLLSSTGERFYRTVLLP